MEDLYRQIQPREAVEGQIDVRVKKEIHVAWILAPEPLRLPVLDPLHCSVDGWLAMPRGLPVCPVADQLLVRTGETARKQSGRGLIGGATDLYLPGRSLIRFL